jgi:uncharacterized membrane protein YphA (DoxX/SURF4 family)
MKRSTISEVISLLFVILFLYTGISKLIDYDIAKEQIALTPILAPIAPEIVIVLPIIEIITAVFLFIPKTRRYGLWASFALMTAFTGYIIYILNYNDQLPCTCGGVLEEMTWPEHLAFNIALIILSLYSLYPRSVSGLFHRTASPLQKKESKPI